MRRWLALAALATAAAALPGCTARLDVGSNDAGIPYDAECKPGTYAGSYSCTSSSSSLFPLSGSGPIVVTLVPAGARTLALPPDASLSSTTSGTTVDSTLMGALDCSTRKLTGSVGKVVFSSPTFNGNISGSGLFEAVYDADASPPALVEGILNPPASLTSTCTWTATLE
jgi:hypothetical protein